MSTASNNRKQAEIFSVPCFAVCATLPQNNPLQIFRCCGRYVGSAFGLKYLKMLVSP